MRVITIGLMCFLLVGCTTQSSQQIVEKGEYTRLQYITEDGLMTPGFERGFYFVLRNGDTGAETRVMVSEEEYDAYVVGDMIER